jgi:hypothetical protein
MKSVPIRLTRRSPAYWLVTIDNPLRRPDAQDAIKALMAAGFHKPGVENRFLYYLSQIAR